MAYTVEQLAQAIRATAGNVSEAAVGLGMSRFGLQKRIAKSAELSQILADERESIVDLAESGLRKRIKEGDTTAMIFTLKTQGRKRGWGEGPTGDADDPIHIKLDR